MQESAPLPYADLSRVLLGVIYDSLLAICKVRFRRLAKERLSDELRKIAMTLMERPWAHARERNNPHLIEDIAVSDHLPRISRLCLEACLRAERYGGFEQSESEPRVTFVPSPLGILVDALTVPSNPESSAYGLAIARAYLFTHFRKHPPSRYLPAGWTPLTIAEIQDSIESFRTYCAHRDNIHNSRSSAARRLVAHFLTLRGIFTLRFGTAGKEPMRVKEAQESCLAFFRNKDFLRGENTVEDYEFRLSAGFEDIPDAQEIVNNLMGIPIPISGAPTVFFGGLLKSHRDSLVMSISGPPGTGKTSLALALAATFAPYGTQCVYCSFEEDEETLRRRVQGLTPPYFRRSTLPNSNDTQWFNTFALNSSEIHSIASFSKRYIEVLQKHVGPRLAPRSESKSSLPALAPLLLVIDSLTNLYEIEPDTNIDAFCALMSDLRDLNCVVLLLSAEEIPKGSRLEYLVDTVVSLRYEGTDSAEKKPTRVFQLVKTRLQLSRPGSHIFHMSGERGLRISPQLPSQLDARKIHEAPLPDRSGVIDTLFVEAKSSTSRERLIDLYRRSRILIYGHGSSGKAPLALKLLMAPSTGSDVVPLDGRFNYPASRILVVSFLYPKKYYKENTLKVSKVLRKTSPNYMSPETSSLVLTPGFIGPEDFIANVVDQLDRGSLEGRPYTGVLLDGLHNVFLQFPSLQKNHMVWPTLYNLLIRYELTVVTTFTTFSKIPSIKAPDFGDANTVLAGQMPFLHALVQAADFFLQVEARDPNVHDRRFHLFVNGAIHQRLPSKALVWNAETFTFDGLETPPISQPELFQQ